MRRPARSTFPTLSALALVAAISTGWASGCEAIVDGQLGTVHCEAEGAVGPPACLEGLVCRDHLCAAAEWGAICTSDADCLSTEFCLDPKPFGGAGSAHCTRVCCSSADCAPDATSVCWAAPAGAGSFCMAAADVGRAAPGEGLALSACSADTDCRSGLCRDARCADTCCDDTSCAPNGACRLEGPPTTPTAAFWCGSPPGTTLTYGPCHADSDCVSGLCLAFDATTSVCSKPCCSSDECSYTTTALPVRCVVLEGAHSGIRACMTELATGMSSVGDACLQDSDCRGGICLDLAGRMQCSDLCCSDDACGENASSEVCRPGDVGGALALRCEPK